MSLLLGSLRGYRHSKAMSENLPIYCVFGDTVMQSIAHTRPSTITALQAIRGFSADKCERYGQEILDLVHSTPEQAPDEQKTPLMRLRGAGGAVRRRVPLASRRRFVPAAPAAYTSAGTNRDGVYILELAQGRVYVGQSCDTRRRIFQHMHKQGSAFTRAFPPTGVLLPRLGCVSGSPEAAERDETLRYMFLRGVQNVRGWRYARVELTEQDVDDAENNIRELHDLCRRCGHPGHFVSQCKATFDRLGRPCKPFH